MKQLIILIGAAALALLALAAAANALTPAPFDPVAYERQRIAIEQAQAIAPAQTVAAVILALMPAALAVVCLVLLAVWGSVAIIRFRRERQPDARGLLPVNAWQLADVAPVALGAYHGARQIEAARQPVPATITYAPHSASHYAPSNAPHYAPRFDYRGDAGGAALPAPDEPTAGAELPGLIDLATLGFTPTREAILLGLGEGGERITVPVDGLCHVALVGATGGGKSNLMRLLLPQLQAIGARVCLADPHFAPIDPDSGEDWRAIASRLHQAPAVSPAEIAALLGYLTDELDRRIAQRRRGERWGAPLFLALDELPVIADTVPGAVDQLGRLLREGRKVGVYSVGASQSMLVKVVGGDSAARECYRTAFYVGGDVRSASALLDMPQREIDDGPLGAGVALLRSKATSPARLVRVPLASNAAIDGLLGTPGGSLMEAKVEQASRSPIRPEVARALELFRSGLDVSQIVKELRGIDAQGGRRYQEAAREMQALLREALAA